MNKLVACVVAVLFLIMAYLQLNDPDPLYWAVVYTAVAAVPLLRVMGRLTDSGFYLASGLVVAGILTSAEGFWDFVRSGDYRALTGEMLANKPYVESAREFLGLSIAGSALAVYRPGTDSTTGS